MSLQAIRRLAIYKIIGKEKAPNVNEWYQDICKKVKRQQEQDKNKKSEKHWYKR